jgi:hypothetical protein
MSAQQPATPMSHDGVVNPIVHAELSWLLSQPLPQRRDRILVTLAGVLPDLDGLGILAGPEAYSRFHHQLAHGYLAAGTLAVAVALLGRKRLWAVPLALVAFHLHLACDLAGSGPDWPLFYFWPTSMKSWMWSGQWDLASWQNGVIGVTASVLCLATAFRLRRTFVELFSLRADAQVVRALWLRFAKREPPASDAATTA